MKSGLFRFLTLKHIQTSVVLLYIQNRGESFRPEYREIASARSLVQVPVLALTATATEDVQKDIFNYLLLAEDAVSIAKLPNRYILLIYTYENESVSFHKCLQKKNNAC